MTASKAAAKASTVRTMATATSGAPTSKANGKDPCGGEGFAWFCEAVYL